MNINLIYFLIFVSQGISSIASNKTFSNSSRSASPAESSGTCESSSLNLATLSNSHISSSLLYSSKQLAPSVTTSATMKQNSMNTTKLPQIKATAVTQSIVMNSTHSNIATVTTATTNANTLKKKSSLPLNSNKPTIISQKQTAPVTTNQNQVNEANKNNIAASLTAIATNNVNNNNNNNNSNSLSISTSKLQAPNISSNPNVPSQNGCDSKLALK